MSEKIKTYGLYNAYFKRVSAPGTTVRQENWMGKLSSANMSNKKTANTPKFKKVGNNSY